jgi:RNA polymerase sigma factor (TIGR02999 family)
VTGVDAYLRRNSGAMTLQATALVHEAYLKLAAASRDYTDRTHFLCTAAAAMRQVLVDHARRRSRIKRGGGMLRITLEGGELGATSGLDILVLHDALDRLESLDERQARIVELRFFVGMNVEEVAELLSISDKTVKRDWAMAREWLQRELAPAVRGGWTAAVATCLS